MEYKCTASMSHAHPIATAAEAFPDFEIISRNIEPIELDDRYNGITIEGCHYFKNRLSNSAREGFIKSGCPLKYSIELAHRATLVRYYNTMPKKYKQLSASQLLQWGTENGLLDLPEIEDLTKSLRYRYSVNARVYYLIQAYLLQFKWIRLQKDENGNYVEINEDKL